MSEKCQTPGATYETKVTSTYIRVAVHLPFILDLIPADASQLEKEIRDAMNSVLAPYFTAQPPPPPNVKRMRPF